MGAFRPREELATHTVRNQPPPLPDYDLFRQDRLLAPPPVLTRAWTAADHERLGALGAACGSEAVRELGRLANETPPKLRAFDRYGRRLDEVEFHPSYHELMALGLEAGVAGRAWSGADGHAWHAAVMLAVTQADSGVTCPMSMTYASVPVLRKDPEVFGLYGAGALSDRYDPRMRPAAEKLGLTLGMAMTEKQGGSDVRANATRAEAGADGAARLVGHKWFCSAPMSDAFLTLAYEGPDLSCFLVPRWRPDGERNAVEIQRLKDKLGDRSNASSEIEYRGAWARRLGERGRGVATIIAMVHHTRFDCVLGAAGVMRRALLEAVWHGEGRTAFQRRLIDQPLMRRTLADLAVEAEAALALSWRLAEALDRGEAQAAFARLAVPAAKYWVTKRCPPMVAECLEVHGGVGYVEETPMPRLYRQAPLNSIWEGSGNVIALDVLRALSREPAALEAVRAELDAARGAYPALDALSDRIAGAGVPDEASARRFAGALAAALQALALIRYAPSAVADAFVALRLEAPAPVFGASEARVDEGMLLGRAALAL